MARRGLTLLMLCALGFPVATGLAQESESPKGWLGVLLRPESPSPGDVSDERPAGVRIARIIQDGPADRAGLRASDVLRTVDGSPVESVPEVISRVSSLPPGSWVAFGIERRGREREVRVRLDTRPTDTSRLDLKEGWIGAEAIDLPPALRVHFGASEESGVMVSDVDERGPAYASGLELGDVVFEVQGQEVRSARQFLALVGGAGVGNPVEIRLMRSGVEIVLEPLVDQEPAEPREPVRDDTPDRG